MVFSVIKFYILHIFDSTDINISGEVFHIHNDGAAAPNTRKTIHTSTAYHSFITEKINFINSFLEHQSWCSPLGYLIV